MNLADASSYFDRTLVTDPATGRVLFKGQIDPYDDSKRDAAAAYRRILSVRPGTAMPASRMVRAMGINWIVGGMEPDGLEEIHREKYVIQRATEQLKVSRLSGFLAGTVAVTLWTSANWVKDAKQLEVSSDTPQIFDVAIPQGADVRVHDVLWSNFAAYLVLSPHSQASGILVANCLKLDRTTPETASLVSRVFDPVTGEYTSPAATTVNALRVRWQSLYAYGSQTAERYQEGDVSIVLPAGTTVSTSTLVTIDSIQYQTLAVLDLGGAVVLHSRKV